jgi:uncharacterized protein (TIGR03435 family)
MRIRWLALAFLALAAAPLLTAQTGQKPAFEVASVRAATPGTRSSQRVTETRLDFINTPLRLVLLTAFRLEPYLLSAPTWLNNTNFDVQATFPAGGRERVPEMLQTLLSERFGLATHLESRPVEAYELVVAKSGITMKEVEPVNELEKDFGGDPATKAVSHRCLHVQRGREPRPDARRSALSVRRRRRGQDRTQSHRELTLLARRL